MHKIKRFSVFQQEIPFINIQGKIQQIYDRFYNTDLGKIHEAFPAESIASKFNLRDKKSSQIDI